MARAIPYKQALRWIIDNDDTDWLGSRQDFPSVTAHLVADIYDKDIEEVAKDLIKMGGFNGSV